MILNETKGIGEKEYHQTGGGVERWEKSTNCSLILLQQLASSLSLLSRFFESETECLLLIMVPACSYQTTSTSFDFFSIKVEANSFLFRWRMQKRKEIGKDPKIKPRMDEVILISDMNIISFSLPFLYKSSQVVDESAQNPTQNFAR